MLGVCFGFVWFYLALFWSVWLNLAQFGTVFWLSLEVLAQFGSVWDCILAQFGSFGSVWLRFVQFGSVFLCLSQFGSVCLSLSQFWLAFWLVLSSLARFGSVFGWFVVGLCSF